MHVVTTNGTRWRRCNQFTDSLLFLTDPPPSVSSFFPFVGMPSYFATPRIQYPFRDLTLIVSSFVSLCIHHPSSSPVIAHFNQQFIPQYSHRLATTALTFIFPAFKYYFILHLIPSPPFISVTCVPVAIYLLGPRRLPKHLFKYIISGILLPLYILTAFSFILAYILHPSLLSPAVVLYHPLSEPDGHRSFPSLHMFVYTSITVVYLPVPIAV